MGNQGENGAFYSSVGGTQPSRKEGAPACEGSRVEISKAIVYVATGSSIVAKAHGRLERAPKPP